MIMLLLSILPGLIKWVGDRALDKYVALETAKLQSASEVKKAEISANIEAGKREQEKREAQRQLQAKDLESPFFRFSKNILVFSICGYWALRFGVKAVGLSDYNVAISELSAEEAVISATVISYLFLSPVIRKFSS